MQDNLVIDRELQSLVPELVASYRSDERTHHIGKMFLPSRTEIIEIVELLLGLIYPGYHGRQNLSWDNIVYHTGELLGVVGRKLANQIHNCRRYQSEVNGHSGPSGDDAVKQARELTWRFLQHLPALREMLAGDVQAAYDGDPAAVNTDEIILAYPGVMAVTIFRIAHELYAMEVPLMPRVMTEYAHSITGVDIHPGATIGRNFFIDHATGVVIGETTSIGDNVKLYQGVTLGALSFPKDERGRLIRGYKRHPTLNDNVTVYSNASILGGDTIIGPGSVVGGNVFLTGSVPANCTVVFRAPDLQYRDRHDQTGHVANQEEQA